jgi:hypothetical protein
MSAVWSAHACLQDLPALAAASTEVVRIISNQIGALDFLASSMTLVASGASKHGGLIIKSAV